MEDDDTDILRIAIQEATDHFCPNSNEFFANTSSSTATATLLNHFMDDYAPSLDFDPSSLVTCTSAAPITFNVGSSMGVAKSGSDAAPGLPYPSPAAGSDLGSADNPIEIIQEGDTYRATTTLTPDQLQQITLLLQQQRHQLQIDDPTTTSEVNNTKIVYHVVRPAALNSRPTTVPSTSDSNGTTPTDVPVRGGSGLKPWGRRRLEEEEEKDFRMAIEPLSQEEKERRKGQQATTRSGRVSKPPSYMVKDYKVIHPLDFDEEAHDAFDGGYTDYRVPDSTVEVAEKLKEVEPEANRSDRRSFKCSTCEKAYIGQGSLKRHYRMFPSHTTSDDSSERPIQETAASAGTDLSGLNETRSRDAKKYLGWYWNRGRGRRHSLKRRSRILEKPSLREVLSCYSNEELLDDGMSELTKVAGTWQFLDTKCKQQPTSDNYIANLYQELEILSENASRVSRQCLQPCVTMADAGCTESSRLQVTNEIVAKLFGVPVGTYAIKKLDTEETIAQTPAKLSADITNTESLDSMPFSPPALSSSSSSRCSVMPETDDDSSSRFPGTQSFHWSSVDASGTDREDSVVSPTMEYSNRLSNLTLTMKDDTESTASVFAGPITDDDSTVEPPDDSSNSALPERDLDAEYQSRLAECKAMADETLVADRGLPFVCLELPAGLLGDDESQLTGDVGELAACDMMPEIPGNLDGLLGAMAASLSDDRSFGRHLVDDDDLSAMDLETGGPMDKDFDILEMLDRAANSSETLHQLAVEDDSCHSFNTVQTLVAVDNMEDN